jgi:putative membrane protein
VPLLAALLAALLVPWPLIWITTLGPTRIFQAQLLAALVLTVVFARANRRFGLVPGVIKRARAREAAAREFLARGLTRTQGRTGVLIYVALAEHYAEVVADEGISSRVDEGVWRETIDILVGQVAQGRLADGLVGAVERVGAVIAEHAPRRPDDRDELPNRVILT